MSKKDPLLHFPFYCNQYLGMLQKYTYEQQGAFIRVLATYVSEDGFISCTDKQSRYRLYSAFTESERNALDIVFKEAVDLAKEIIARQKAIRNIRREAGKQGGRPAQKDKKQKVNHKDNQKVNHKGKQNKTYTETETET
jgi:uncharacterized protein YdaU (DUF1376 family)